jgi:hypothetical protein
MNTSLEGNKTPIDAMFLIIALDKTKKKDACIRFWRPNNAGYCTIQSEAGFYKKEHIFDSYHNSFTAKSVEFGLIKDLFITVNGNAYLPNCQTVLDVLNVEFYKGRLIRKK